MRRMGNDAEAVEVYRGVAREFIRHARQQGRDTTLDEVMVHLTDPKRGLLSPSEFARLRPAITKAVAAELEIAV
jgi:hypothetical protein